MNTTTQSQCVDITQEDLERGACLKMRRYLLAKGDPNAIIPMTFRPSPVTDPLTVVTVSLSYLQKCCLEEDASLVALLLENEHTIVESPITSSFPSPLHMAASWKRVHKRKVRPGSGITEEELVVSHGSKALVEALLRRGADPNGHHTRFPLTPLHLALCNGNVPIAHSLILGGANPLVGCRMGLFCTATARTVGGLLLLRSANPAAVSAIVQEPVDSKGRTILHVACDDFFFDPECTKPDTSMELWERQLFYVETALALEVPIDHQDEHGNTALHYAWRCGNARVAQFLVKVGKADTQLQNEDGLTALQCHPTGRSAALLTVQGLVNCRDSCGPLCMPAYLRFLLDYGLGEVSKKCEVSGEIALHAFCASSAVSDLHLVLLEVLLQHGSDPNTMSYQQETPLFLAAKTSKSASFIKLLVEYGGDPNVVCGGKYTPLQMLSKVDPYPSVGDAALVLVLDGGVDLNDCGLSADSNMPFTGQTEILQHPCWASFWLWLHPPRNEYAVHDAARSRFQQYTAGDTTHLVGNVTDFSHHPTLAADSTWGPTAKSDHLNEKLQQDVESDSATTVSFGQSQPTQETDTKDGGPRVTVLHQQQPTGQVTTHHTTVESPTATLDGQVLDAAEYRSKSGISQRAKKREGVHPMYKEHESFVRTLHETLNGSAYHKVHPNISTGAIGVSAMQRRPARHLEELEVESSAHDAIDSKIEEKSFAAQQRFNDSQLAMNSSGEAGLPEAIPFADDATVYQETLLLSGSLAASRVANESGMSRFDVVEFNYLAQLLEQRDRDYDLRQRAYASLHNTYRHQKDLERRAELKATREAMLAGIEELRHERVRQQAASMSSGYRATHKL